MRFIILVYCLMMTAAPARAQNCNYGSCTNRQECDLVRTYTEKCMKEAERLKALAIQREREKRETKEREAVALIEKANRQVRKQPGAPSRQPDAIQHRANDTLKGSTF